MTIVNRLRPSLRDYAYQYRKAVRIIRKTNPMRSLMFSFWVLTAAVGLGGSARALPPPDQAVTPERSNALTCLRGLAGCDISALNPEELKHVAAESRKRNLDYCLNGSSLCDPT